jgi:hypothetical protein
MCHHIILTAHMVIRCSVVYTSAAHLHCVLVRTIPTDFFSLKNGDSDPAVCWTYKLIDYIYTGRPSITRHVRCTACESVSDYRARKYNALALPTYAPQRHEAPNRSRIYLYACGQPWLESHHIIVLVRLDHLLVLCTSAKRRGGSIDCKVRS